MRKFPPPGRSSPFANNGGAHPLSENKQDEGSRLCENVYRKALRDLNLVQEPFRSVPLPAPRGGLDQI